MQYEYKVGTEAVWGKSVFHLRTIFYPQSDTSGLYVSPFLQPPNSASKPILEMVIQESEHCYIYFRVLCVMMHSNAVSLWLRANLLSILSYVIDAIKILSPV